MKIEDACPTCGALCEVDLGAEEGEYVAIEQETKSAPTQGADGESLRPVAIYQVHLDAGYWWDCDKGYYDREARKPKRIVYTVCDATPDMRDAPPVAMAAETVKELIKWVGICPMTFNGIEEVERLRAALVILGENL